MAIDSGIWDINFTVTIGEDDVSEYVINIYYKSSLCAPAGHLEILFAPNMERDIIPYEDVVITIDETKVFTGYTQKEVMGRRPVAQVVECEDALARVRDTWSYNQNLEANGESTHHWISYFLNLAGVPNTVAGGGPPIPPKRWGVVNCYQAIAGMLKLVNWTLAVDANGTVVVKHRAKDPTNAITVNHTSWERTISDEWLRNRAIVLGRNEEASLILDGDVPELYGEIRAAIVASPDIIWPSTAYAMAEIILNEFSEPLDMIVLEAAGNPNIALGSTVYVTDTWEDHSRYGKVTGLQWRVNAKEGYVMTLSLDEKCPSFWMADMEPNILYAATEGAGVWKSYNDGVSWNDISGDDLNDGLPSYVKDIHVIKGLSLIGTDDTVWAATLGGIFRTENGAAPWINITEEYMDSKAQTMDWWGIKVGPIDHDKVYCLGNAAEGPTEVYDNKDNYITTLPSRSVMYMYISYDGGLTWVSYPVNGYSGEA